MRQLAMTPRSRAAVRSALVQFLRHPEQWAASVWGTEAVCSLEARFAALVGRPHALAVSNATLGLWAVFRATGVQDADVVTTPYTWGGSLAGIILAGNRPVFADVDDQTLTLDPEKVVRAITPRTRAILAVDIYGYPCPGRELRQIADDHGLLLVQDCAQSFGAYVGDRHTGYWADAAVFSFTWGKALFAGEGGMVVTGDRSLFRRLVRDTQHPLRQRRDVPEFAVNELALNMRINPFAAVCADAAFEAALAAVARHRARCMEVLQGLQDAHVSKSRVPGPKMRPSFHALTFEPCRPVSEVQRVLDEEGWAYKVCAPPVPVPIYSRPAFHELALSRGWSRVCRCPIAEAQCARRLRLVKVGNRRAGLASSRTGRRESRRHL